MIVSSEIEDYDPIGKLIGALVLMEGKRSERRSFAPGLWLLSVRSLALALLVETSVGHELWLEELSQVDLTPSRGDDDVVAEVRRVVLGEDIPRPPISVAQVLTRMGFLGLTGPGGGGS